MSDRMYFNYLVDDLEEDKWFCRETDKRLCTYSEAVPAPEFYMKNRSFNPVAFVILGTGDKSNVVYDVRFKIESHNFDWIRKVVNSFEKFLKTNGFVMATDRQVFGFED